MCGHGTIGAVTTMLELGGVPLPNDAATCTVIVDTPSGPVRAFATLDRSAGEVRVTSVAIQLESAFVHASDQPLDVPGLGTLRVDLVCVGGYFAMVTADQIELPLVAAEAPALAEAGMAIIDAANRELTVQHPEHPYVNTIDVTEFHVLDAPGQSRNAVVYGEAHVDRSPCGTGTSAKMALLFHQGNMEVGDSLVNTGLLGTTFTGRIVAETTVGPFAAIVPEIRGQAHLTGRHRFIVREDDPFPRGFLF
jgi:proline racemase